MAKRGRPAKTSWRPCSICGTMEGHVPAKAVTPARFSLKRFGLLNEVGCRRCYDRLNKKAWRERKRGKED